MTTEQSVDRFSTLSDGVICHILSFMPTQLSVKTSVLAKRWRFMWAHVPILDFKVISQTTSFVGFICALMLRHKVERLNTFRLHKAERFHTSCLKYTDDDEGVHTGRYELQTCIYTAIERNVQNLDLHLPVELPRCALTCKTLGYLRMGGGVSIPSGVPICLPILKKLYIYRPIGCDAYLSSLVSSCPVLEELIIDQVSPFHLKNCTLSSPTLKSLTISFSFYADNAYHLVEINASALRYLKVHGYMYKLVLVSLMNTLIEADIIMRNDASCVLKLLDRICDVKCLKLSCFTEQMPASIVKFGSLIKLQLSDSWCLLTKFLENADHLQELIIHEKSWHSQDWKDPIEEGCACLLHSLRTVRIDDFACTEEGFNMIRFVLRNAQVLEQMEIYCPLDSQKKYDAIRRISSFRRGSKECELAFY